MPPLPSPKAAAVESAISIENLTKEFPGGERGSRVRALDGLSFDVEPGSIFGLLGPNGSGKSTTIKILMGLLRPDSGKTLIHGAASASAAARASVGYMPEGPYYYRFMSGQEALVYFGRLGGLDKSVASERAGALLERVGLASAASRRLGGYSKGMLQRFGLAQSLINDPRVVILDEPVAGVDPVGAADIVGLISKLKQEGRTVLLCSHLLSHVERICDHVVILHQGKSIASGKVEELTAPKEARYAIEGLDEADAQELGRQAIALGGMLRRNDGRRSLEEFFLENVNASSEESK